MERALRKLIEELHALEISNEMTAEMSDRHSAMHKVAIGRAAAHKIARVELERILCECGCEAEMVDGHVVGGES